MMRAMILKTYQALNLPIPGKDGLMTKALVFCEDLEDIPDNELDHCFRQARIVKNDSFFPSTGQITRAWEVRRDEIKRKKEMNAHKMLEEPAPEEMARDCSEYIKNPTQEGLENLRNKYPNAGF